MRDLKIRIKLAFWVLIGNFRKADLAFDGWVELRHPELVYGNEEG